MRTVLAGSLVLMTAAAAAAQSTPAPLKDAAKMALVVNVGTPAEIGASQTTCRIPGRTVAHHARTELDNSPIALTDTHPDVTVIVDVELYRVELDEPVNMCIARVSLRAGVKTEIVLPYSNARAERRVYLFRRESKVARPMNGFDSEVFEAVNGIVKEFVGAWAKDQKN